MVIDNIDNEKNVQEVVESTQEENSIENNKNEDKVKKIEFELNIDHKVSSNGKSTSDN